MPPDAPAPDSAAPAALEYGHARPQLPWKRFVKPLLLGLTLAVLVGAALAASWRLKLLSAQRGMLEYAPATGTVAYEENPAEAARLAKLPGYRRGLLKKSSAYLEPPQWQAFRDAFERGENGYFLFAHERAGPSGARRLAMVFLYGRPGGGEDETRLTFDGVVVEPAAFFKDGSDVNVVTQRLRTHLSPDDELRLFVGRVDPADRTRFTIECDVNGKRNVIDGVLTRLESVELTPRSGTVLKDGWTDHWYPDGSKLRVPAQPPRRPMPPLPPGLKQFFPGPK